MDGTAAVGVGATYARADHVHPSDTTRYAASNPSGFQTAAQVTASLGPYALTSAVPTASSTTPLMNGAAAIGSGVTWAKADHVHPTDTTLLPKSGGALTGALTPSTTLGVVGTTTNDNANAGAIGEVISFQRPRCFASHSDYGCGCRHHQHFVDPWRLGCERRSLGDYRLGRRDGDQRRHQQCRLHIWSQRAKRFAIFACSGVPASASDHAAAPSPHPAGDNDNVLSGRVGDVSIRGVSGLRQHYREAGAMKLLHFLFPILALLDAASAPAQQRQPAQITTLPTTSPQEFDLLDNTGKWMPFGTGSNGAFTVNGAGTDVRSFGCVADGVTDQTTCINNALANASDCVIIPATQNGFYVAGTLNVAKCLRGTVFNPASTTPTYDHSGSSRILCNNQAAQPCVVVNRVLAGTSGQSTQIADISLIGTNAGDVSATPAAGSKGFQWQQGSNLILTNFQSSNFDSCAYFGPATASPGTGPLGTRVFNGFFSRCQKHYVVVDGVAEIYLFGGRFGNTGDYPSADDFIYATKTTSAGAGAGPNTVVLDSVQLNTASVGCPLRWGGFTGTGGSFGANKVSNSHIEINDAGYTGSATQGMICVDNTMPIIPGMQFTNNSIQTDGGSTLHPTFNIAPTVPWKDTFSFVNNRPLMGAPFTLTLGGMVGNAFTPTFIGNYMQSNSTFTSSDYRPRRCR